MLKKLRRLADLSPAESLVFFQLAGFAVAARIALWVLPLPRMMNFVAWCANHRWLSCLPLFQNRCDIKQLTRLADYGARVARADGPCLLRSLSLFWLLKARREPAELVIGVTKKASALHGHAWVESQGNVLGDSEENAFHFATLLRF